MQHTPSRRTFLQMAMAAGAGALAGKHAWARTASGKKPNILIIMADDMGWSDAGCYGGEITTRHLDGLAANGLRFTQYYSTARCWPSRACILTGYYAQQVRMDPPKPPLPAWARVLPHYFKPAGYRCYHSGKWHLAGAPKAVADGGFDHSYLLKDHDRFFSPKKHFLDDEPLPPIEDDSDFYVTTHIADHNIECLQDHAKNHPDTPFLSYLAFTSPHFPLHALQDDIDRYRELYKKGWDAVRQERLERQHDLGLLDAGLSERQPDVVPPWNLSEEELQEMIGPGEAGHAVAWDSLTEEQKDLQATKMAIHAAMVDRMDRDIGRVLDQLKAMGAYDDTIVVFMSDNGASAEQIIRGDMHDKEAPLGSAESYLCLGPGWSTAANTPFRYHKHWVHEGGCASPLIVHWPNGGLPAGALRTTPGHFIDLLPTMLEVSGIDPEMQWQGEEPPPFPGKSLVPAFQDDVRIDRGFLYWHHQGNRAYREGDWKIVAPGKDAPWELYNMAEDRAETNDLAAKHPEKVAAMAAAWQKKDTLFRQQAGYDS
ncbi:MAG: arylsulfatase [Candidatus Hydrogenedentota bacterium]